MEQTITWILIGLVALVALSLLVVFIIKFFKMKPEERKELIVQFLIGLVTIAEAEFVGQGRGVEKVNWVEAQFMKNAPWFLKLLLFFTKSANLTELVEKALTKAKETVFDQYKK